MEKIVYTPSQQHVIDTAQEVLDRKGYLFINAPAGYGKTFIAKQVAPHATLSATTHDAARVLDPTAKTIHSLLGLAPVNDTLVQKFNLKLEKDETVIIDEASMIGEELFGFIDDVKNKKNLQVIFLGDLKQLPPVNDTHPEIFFDEDISMELLEPVRQDLDSDIYKLSMFIRDKIGTNTEVLYKDIEPFFGEEIKKISFSDYIDKVTKKDKLTAYTNYAVDTKGKIIHEKIHGKPLVESITELDMDVKNNPHPIGSTQQLFMREPVRVTGIEFFAKVVGQDVYKVNIKGMTFYWTDGSLPLVARHFAKKVHAKIWTWPKYYSVVNAFINLESPYSKTTHRFQGRTVESIALDWENITKKRKTGNTELINKLLYVAVSRAKNQVEIIV